MDATRRSTSSSRVEIESGSSTYEQKVEADGRNNEKRVMQLDGTERHVSKEEDIELCRRSTNRNRLSQDHGSLRREQSHHSRAGGDGYTCFDTEANHDRPARLKDGAVTEQPFLVTWDGDADPENPRSMSSFRRWVIVLICAASSLCVYVVDWSIEVSMTHRLTFQMAELAHHRYTRLRIVRLGLRLGSHDLYAHSDFPFMSRV